MTTEDMVSLRAEGSATSSALPAGLVSHKTRQAATNNWDKNSSGSRLCLAIQSINRHASFMPSVAYAVDGLPAFPVSQSHSIPL